MTAKSIDLHNSLFTIFTTFFTFLLETLKCRYMYSHDTCSQVMALLWISTAKFQQREYNHSIFHKKNLKLEKSQKYKFYIFISSLYPFIFLICLCIINYLSCTENVKKHSHALNINIINIITNLIKNTFQNTYPVLLSFLLLPHKNKKCLHHSVFAQIKKV